MWICLTVKIAAWLDAGLFIFPLEANANFTLELQLPQIQNNNGYPVHLVAHISVLFAYLNVGKFCIFDPYNGTFMSYKRYHHCCFSLAANLAAIEKQQWW